MSKIKHLKTPVLTALLALLGLSCGAALAQSAAAATASKAPALAAPADATIGTMTNLAKRIKIASMEKDLRELADKEKEAKAAAAAVAPSGVLAASKPIKFVPPPPQAPRVTAVTGVGDKLQASLAGGQLVSVGATVGLWRVVSIRAAGVEFERCETKMVGKGKKAKPGQTECEIQMAMPRAGG